VHEGWGRDDIDMQLTVTKTRTITLGEPLRVIVAFLTAAANVTGTALFFDDIHGKDGS